MDNLGLSGPVSEAGEGEPAFVCDICSKTYQRRDLLARHRRRCQDPANRPARRKACDACVQAKTKCCYSQPSCARCLKRGFRCQYASASLDDIPPRNAREVSSNRDKHSLPQMSTSASSETRSPEETRDVSTNPDENPMLEVCPTLDSLELPLWTADMESWALSNFNMPMMMTGDNVASAIAGSEQSYFVATDDLNFGTNMVSHPGNVAAVPTDSVVLSSPPQAPASMRNGLVTNASEVPNDPSLYRRPSARTVQLTDTTVKTARSSTGFHDDSTIESLLYEYPSLLVKDTFQTPLLHFSMYEYENPDITLLPLTTMAISCGRGLMHKDSSRFMKRAMDGERQRLISQFPEYKCMQQWDALHAMALYEIIELRDARLDSSELWKLRPQVLGLRFPFILKMAQIYADSYTELRNPDFRAFEVPTSAPGSETKDAWHRWRITETARRTLFLLNMVNWRSHYDHMNEKQLPYYESLCNDVVLDLPLPCSHRAWVAQDEKEWRAAMQTQEMHWTYSVGTVEAGASYVRPEVTLTKALSSLHGHDGLLPPGSTTELVLKRLGETAGLADSDQLRCFIVFAAWQQFPMHVPRTQQQ